MIHDPASAATPVAPAGQKSAARVTFTGLAVPVFLAAILVPVGLMVYSAVRGGDSLVRTAADAITAAATTGRAAPATLTLTDLDDLSPGYHTLDAAPPSSGYASFDAIGALPWAVTIAQAWVGDARLDRIDVVRVQPDGLIDVADDREAEVTYRFVSPDRVKELRRRADLSANANVQTEFWVRVKGGQASVIAPTTPAALLAFRDHEGAAARAPQRAAARRDIRQACGVVRSSMRRFTRAICCTLEGEGWVWYFSTLSGEPLPRVRSTDAKTYPYK